MVFKLTLQNSMLYWIYAISRTISVSWVIYSWLSMLKPPLSHRSDSQPRVDKRGTFPHFFFSFFYFSDFSSFSLSILSSGLAAHPPGKALVTALKTCFSLPKWLTPNCISNPSSVFHSGHLMMPALLTNTSTFSSSVKKDVTILMRMRIQSLRPLLTGIYSVCWLIDWFYLVKQQYTYWQTTEVIQIAQYSWNNML